MLSIKFMINGREISPGAARNELEAEVLRSLAECIRAKVGGMRCEEHDRSPRITVHGVSLKDLGFEIEGCCQKLKESVLLSLAAPRKCD